MIAVTGASGQLGQLVIENLINKGVRPSHIVAIARNPSKLEALTKKGIQVREGDYTKPETFKKALEGVEKLLLVSSSEVGQRLSQHKNVIDSLEGSSVKQLAYTSILHADKSPLGLAKEHIATEKLIADLKIATTILRNGWYSENYTMGIPTALEHSALIGCADEGRIASATRNDYALAAATVLTEAGHENKVYELAGDSSYSLKEFAEIISDVFGKKISYNNLAEAEYRKILMDVGLPEVIADMLANSETGASKGGLFDDSKTLSKLIKRPTESMRDVVVKLAK